MHEWLFSSGSCRTSIILAAEQADNHYEALSPRIAMEAAIGATFRGVPSVLVLSHADLFQCADTWLALGGTRMRAPLVLIMHGVDPDMEEAALTLSESNEFPIFRASAQAPAAAIHEAAFSLSARHLVPVVVSILAATIEIPPFRAGGNRSLSSRDLRSRVYFPKTITSTAFLLRHSQAVHRAMEPSCVDWHTRFQQVALSLATSSGHRALPEGMEQLKPGPTGMAGTSPTRSTNLGHLPHEPAQHQDQLAGYLRSCVDGGWSLCMDPVRLARIAPDLKSHNIHHLASPGSEFATLQGCWLARSEPMQVLTIVEQDRFERAGVYGFMNIHTQGMPFMILFIPGTGKDGSTDFMDPARFFATHGVSVQAAGPTSPPPSPGNPAQPTCLIWKEIQA